MRDRGIRHSAACITTAIAMLSCSHAASALVATHLQCEYRENPLGVDVENPRMNWVMEEKSQKTGDRRLQMSARGQRQTAYQVLVASSEELLKKDKGDLWDSGKVSSDQSIHVQYQGKPLPSRQQCFWKVRAWLVRNTDASDAADKDGEISAWSQPATWTMGLLTSEAWVARWIGATAVAEPQSTAGLKPGATVQLRKEFAIDKDISRAVVFVCGLGLCELSLNGKKVGDGVLDPGWTNYRKTCLYTAYDVTAQLARGRNAVGVMLGNGMYNVPGGRYAKFTGSFGPPKVILQLHIEHADGSSTVVVSDESWTWSPSPVIFSCIFGGEDYDANLFQRGWDQPGFSDARWAQAVVTKGPGGVLKGLSCAAPPVRYFDTLKPVTVTTVKPGITLYDLGQNAAQMPRITVRGLRGSSVKILPAEIVRKDGSIDQTSVGGNISCTYRLDGSGRETWSPRFFYCGYRYLQIECIAAAPGGALPVVDSVEGRVVHTSSTPIGEFVTSNDLINRIYAMIRWAQRSNMVSVMTDCPHREKLCWLEQTHLNGPALRYNYDLNAFFNKLMNDMTDSQLDNGLIPDIAPEYPVFDGGFRDSPEWGSAFPQVAWHQYLFSGDIELLRRFYDGMARYVAYLESKAVRHILSYGLGDWRELEWTPNAITATTIFYDDAMILARAAALLGKTDDEARYSKLAANIAAAFNQKFFNPTTRQYAGGSQTANAIPLAMGLVPPEHRRAVLDNLVKHLQTHGLKAGEIGFPYLLRALAQGGRSDAIFTMINQTDKPGYGFQLKYGATSLPEDWDYQPGSSQNHFMLGHINEWFIHDLAGIQSDPQAVGFKKIVIKPVPVGDLTWVKAHYDSLYGRVVSNWKRDDSKLTMDVMIPVNTTATVYVPAKDAAGVTESGKPIDKAEGVTFLRMENGAAVYEVRSGCYQFAAQ